MTSIPTKKSDFTWIGAPNQMQFDVDNEPTFICNIHKTANCMVTWIPALKTKRQKVMHMSSGFGKI